MTGGGGGACIHLATVSIFARMTGEKKGFYDVPQQVLSEVVARSSSILLKMQ